MHFRMYAFESIFGLCVFKMYAFEMKKLFCDIEKIWNALKCNALKYNASKYTLAIETDLVFFLIIIIFQIKNPELLLLFILKKIELKTFFYLKLIEGGVHPETSLTGVVVGVDVTREQKLWRCFQALGNIAFAYAYSQVLIEIQVNISLFSWTPTTNIWKLKNPSFNLINLLIIFNENINFCTKIF